MPHPSLQFDAESLAEICRRYQVRELCVFGSATNGEFGPASDVDVLIEYLPEKRFDFFTLIEMKTELEALFGRAVDVIEGRDLIRNPYRRKNILSQLEQVYAA